MKQLAKSEETRARKVWKKGMTSLGSSAIIAHGKTTVTCRRG